MTIEETDVEDKKVAESSRTSRPLALITGGTSGIGLGIAHALIADYDLALGYHSNHEAARAARNALLADTPREARIDVFSRPLSNATDASDFLSEVVEAMGASPTILVHGAGRVNDRLFLQSPLATHLDRLGEHLVVAMALAHGVLQSMYRRRFGRIVFLSSIGAHYVKRGQCGYAAAKAGLEGFTRCLALEVAHRGITVNAVAPGLIDTPMTEALLAKLNNEGPLRRKIPAGYAGCPAAVGDLVRFLCSQEAAYMTGVVLPVDGGRSLGDPS